MIIHDLYESPQLCPECGGISFSDLILAEKKDACYYKVKASAKVWPSAYASGRLVQCRKKGAGNYGNKSEGVAEDSIEEVDRRGFLRGLGAAAVAGAAGSAMAQSRPVDDVSREFQNMRQDDPRVQHNKDIEEMARAIYEQIVATRGRPIDRRQQQMWMTIAREKATEKLSKYAPGRPAPQSQSSGFPAQGSERRVSRNIDNFESQGVAEEYELAGVGVAYELGRRAYKERKTARDNPYSATREARKNDEWAKGLERGKHDANDARHFRSSVREQGVAEKLGDNRPKLGSKRDAGKSVRKWRKSRGLDETDQVNEKSVSQAQFRTMAAAAHNPEFARKVGIKQSVAKEFNQADKGSNYKKLPDRTNEGGDVFMANIKDTPEYKAGFATGKLPVPHPEGTQQYASYYKGVIDKASPTLNKVGEGEQQKGADYRDPPEADYGDDYQDMVARMKKLAGLGPLKTVYDPAKRVYRNMPTAVQPKK
jgi:hypothetical protein